MPPLPGPLSLGRPSGCPGPVFLKAGTSPGQPNSPQGHHLLWGLDRSPGLSSLTVLSGKGVNSVLASNQWESLGRANSFGAGFPAVTWVMDVVGVAGVK